MAIRRELGGIAPHVERQAVLRIREEDLERLEKHLFQRYPSREWGTFFEFGFCRTTWGLAMTYVNGLWPEPGDLDRQVGLTRFNSQYSRRAFRHSAESTLAVGVVHSHPEGCGTFPSALDDDMDTYFAREFSAYTHGAPYCSLILQRSARTGLTFTARIFDRGEWIHADSLVVVGVTSERFQSETKRASEMPPEGYDDHATTARLRSVMGERSAARLRGSTVGVVGCSGTGSPAVHVLARAGVGEFVLVDPERFAPSNLERMHGSTRNHADLKPGPYKVEMMRQLIESINPLARITTFAGNILHDNVRHELLRCDMLLGCTDTQHARAALSDLASHYLLPSVDVGVLMEGAGGRVSTQLIDVTVFSPRYPCGFCTGRIDGVALSEELASPEEIEARQRAAVDALKRGDDPDQYWHQQQRQLHTVGYLTSIAGSLIAGYAEGMLTGAFEPPHSSFQFDIGRERLGVTAPPRRRLEGCTCEKHRGWSDSARSFCNVTRPPHWSSRGVLLHVPTDSRFKEVAQ